MVHADLLRRRIKPPALAILSQIFETLFFVSLQTEEAEPLTCSITYLDSRSPDPDPPLRIMSSRWKCTRLQRPVTFNVANLAKMAKAADPAATSLAVYSDSRGRPYIWGLIDQVPVHYARMVTRESEWGPEIPGVFQAV